MALPQSDLTYDAIILGAGPAGLASGLSLKSHNPECRVAVVDCAGFRSVYGCETISRSTRMHLARLGLWEDFEALQHNLSLTETAVSWGAGHTDADALFRKSTHTGWRVHRPSFELWLMAAAKNAGIEWMTTMPRLKRSRHTEDGWILVFDDQSILSRVVIDASGRRAAFAHSQGINREEDDALVGRYRIYAPPAGSGCFNGTTHIEAWEDGWWHAGRSADGRAFVGCFTDATIAARSQLDRTDVWRSRLEMTAPGIAEQVAPHTMLNDSVIRPASSGILTSPIGDDWLAVGDAASTYDPISGDEMVRTFQSGMFAANAVRGLWNGQGDALDRYAKVIQKNYQASLARRTEFYRAEPRWSHRTFWGDRLFLPGIPAKEKVLTGDTLPQLLKSA